MSASVDLGQFTQDTPAFLEQLRETGLPIVLTINGKAELVVQEAGSYQRLLELVDRLEAVEGIKRGLEAFQRGEGRPAGEALEELRNKLKIPADA